MIPAMPWHCPCGIIITFIVIQITSLTASAGIAQDMQLLALLALHHSSNTDNNSELALSRMMLNVALMLSKNSQSWTSNCSCHHNTLKTHRCRSNIIRHVTALAKETAISLMANLHRQLASNCAALQHLNLLCCCFLAAQQTTIKFLK